MKLGGWLIMLVTMSLFLSLIGFNIVGLNPINQAVGVNISESNSTIISADVESSNFWTRLFGESAFTLFGVPFTAGILVLLVGAGTIAVGLFAKGYDTSLVILPFVVFVAGLFISTFWAIISHVKAQDQAWMTNITTILFVGLAVGFIMACVDYFAGR